jgi:hypothetical protein
MASARDIARRILSATAGIALTASVLVVPALGASGSAAAASAAPVASAPDSSAPVSSAPVSSAPVSPAPVSSAPPGSAFDPGFIISDAVMFDYKAMSIAQIDEFLDSKVATCAASSPQPCLKDYTANTRDVKAVANRCPGNIVGAKNQTAGQIIYAVAQACEVNPKALIVTLQKEQGLVTATSTSASRYDRAMGYGCPDTAPCDSEYFGFFNQMYQAAYAFNKYTKSPSQYPAYQPGTRKIQYHPTASCGSQTVVIRNKATTALYTYTPYTPNEASLANPYATGDKCSSYGNRNFWLYYNDWFGSSIAGGFLIDTAEGRTYVLVGGQKWEIPASRVPGLTATLAPLGTAGRVSAAYADTYPTAGTFGNVVTSQATTTSPLQYWLLDGGTRIALSGCEQARALGFPCDSVPLLTNDMIGLFSERPLMTDYVTVGEARYLLGGGVKRQILDSPALAAAGVVLGARTELTADTASVVPYGAPYALVGSIARETESSSLVYLTASATYRIPASLVEDTDIEQWVGSPTGVLDAASVAMLPTNVLFRGLYRDDRTGVSRVLTTRGGVTITAPQRWPAVIPAIDPALADRLPVAAGSVGADLLAVNAHTSAKYLLSDGIRRPLPTKALRKKVASAYALSPSKLPKLGRDTLAAIGAKRRAGLVPGSVVKKSAKAKDLWLIDGIGAARPIAPSRARELTGSSAASVVSKSALASYSKQGAVRLGVQCGAKRWVADGGVIRRLTAANAKAYPSSFFTAGMDKSTCRAFDRGSKIGTAVSVGYTYYVIRDGKKRVGSYSAATAAAKKSKAPIQSVSRKLVARIPTAK